MSAAKTLHICMGSACHQVGVYDVIKIFQDIIHDNELENQLQLKGAFCLGVCAKGIVMKIDNQVISNVNIKNAKEKFFREIIPLLKLEHVQ